MKTMLGGWEEVQRSLAERRSVSVQRCVAIAPRDSAKAALWQSHSSRRTCLGLETPEHTLAPASEPLPPRSAARRLPPPLPAHLRPAPAAGSGRASAPPVPLARLALDATCEIRDIDLIVMSAPALAAEPTRATGGRGTQGKPASARSQAGWLGQLRRWAKRTFRARAPRR